MDDQSSHGDWQQLYSRHLETWQRRFAEALAACRLDGVLIASGLEIYHARDDLSYPYAAEPYFKAWLPLMQHPGSVLKIVPGQRPLLVYFQTPDFWRQPPAEPEGYWVEHFEILYARSRAEVIKALDVPPQGFGVIENDAEELLGSPSDSDPSLLHFLDYYRAFKTPYEVACIERANWIAAAGHSAARHAFSGESSEFQLNQIYCSATEQREAELPYQNIVALNDHAAILHYQNLDRQPPAEVRSFLLDAGAQFNGYAADVSRTWSRGEERFDALIDSIDSMQKALCVEARTGVSFTYLNELAHQMLGEILVQHGIVLGSAQSAYASGITRDFLPHGLGHLLGLQVHDAGGHLASPHGARNTPPEAHPSLRLTRVLEPGFVLTIEPGVYFIPALLDAAKKGKHAALVDWAVVDELLPFGGVRIEDNILVTDQGARNLSRPALSAAGIS